MAKIIGDVVTLCGHTFKDGETVQITSSHTDDYGNQRVNVASPDGVRRVSDLPADRVDCGAELLSFDDLVVLSETGTAGYDAGQLYRDQSPEAEADDWVDFVRRNT